VSVLYVAPVGAVARESLEWIEAAATEWFPFPVRRLPAMPVPEGCYDAARGQYQSFIMMQALARQAPRDAERILGITEGDLGTPVLTFLFGQAQLDGLVALVSLSRLRQEFYGLPPDDSLLRDRTIKEVLHELGHTFGLKHCMDAGCTMTLSTHIQLVDAKGAGFCGSCAGHLAGRFGASEPRIESSEVRRKKTHQ
jgi:archaemetzincin